MVLIFVFNIEFLFLEFFKNESFGIETRIFQIISFILIITFFRWFKKSTELTLIESSLSNDDFKNLVKATANDLDWNIEHLTQDYAICYKHVGWQWDGLKIIILKSEDSIGFNSMVAPSIRSNPFSGGWNKRNLKVFKDNLKKLKSSINILELSIQKIEKKEKEYLNDSEWSFKNMLIRLVFYSLSLMFLALGIWLISGGVYFGFFIALLSIPYVYMDIKVIREKSTKKKVPNIGYDAKAK